MHCNFAKIKPVFILFYFNYFIISETEIHFLSLSWADPILQKSSLLYKFIDSQEYKIIASLLLLFLVLLIKAPNINVLFQNYTQETQSHHWEIGAIKLQKKILALLIDCIQFNLSRFN